MTNVNRLKFETLEVGDVLVIPFLYFEGSLHMRVLEQSKTPMVMLGGCSHEEGRLQRGVAQLLGSFRANHSWRPYSPYEIDFGPDAGSCQLLYLAQADEGNCKEPFVFEIEHLDIEQVSIFRGDNKLFTMTLGETNNVVP